MAIYIEDRRSEFAARYGTADPAAAVRAILSAADERLDYCQAKLAFDRLVDPASDAAATRAQLDRLLSAAQELAGPAAGPDARLAALRRTLYVAGPWNDHRPFAYDHDDPRRIANKLLANYIATRRGNCVSMPTLLLILAERMGLDVALAMAPQHAFVRYRDERGRVVNLETTSGADPARDAWYREVMPMSDRSVASGLYLRTLSKREGVALLATTVGEHAYAHGRFATVLAVSAAILQSAPRDALTLMNHGMACDRLIEREFVARYPLPLLIPPRLRGRYLALCRRNRDAFAAAAALGWEPVA